MRFSLQEKIVVITFLVILAGSIFAVYFSNTFSQRVVINEMGIHLAKEVTMVKYFLEDWLDNATNNVAVWGSIPVFVDAVTESGPHREKTIKKSEQQLRKLVKKYKQFIAAHIYRLDGSMAASSLNPAILINKSTNVADCTYFTAAAAGSPYISKIITSRYMKKKLFVISAPVQKEGQVVGVVVGVVTTELLSHALRELENLQQDTEIFLIDKNNYPIISSKKKEKDGTLSNSAIISMNNIINHIVKHSCPNKNQTFSLKPYCMDEQHIYVASSLSENNWKIIEIHKIDKIKSAGQTVLKYSAIVTIVALFWVSITLLFIYRKYIFSRLENLQRKIQLLEQGKLETRIQTDHGKDEISLLIDSFNKMAIQLQESIESLSASRKQFQLAVDGSNDGIWDWDITRDIVYTSSRWKAQLGYNASELENLAFTSIRKFIYAEDLEKLDNYTRLFLRGEIKGKFDIEFRVHHKNGSIRWIRSRAIMLRDEKGKPCRLTGSNTDTTIEHLITEQLLKAKEKAETANRYKSEFLANMSHEIRTPIGFITGLCYMIKGTQLNTDQIDYIDKIEKSAGSLLAIVNDVLDFSKIEAGKLEIDLQSINLHEILASIIESFSTIAEEKGVALRLYVSPDIPHALQSDHLRLNQVLTNLVNNSIKFTSQGEIVVEANCLNKSEKSVELEILVRDTGIGMTEEQQDRIFNAFSQADTFVAKQFGGTGLGLVISRDLLGLLGGSISVKSKPGKGTEFTINLRMDRTDVPAEQEETELLATKISENADVLPTKVDNNRVFPEAKVLLVEDNQINIMIAQSLLGKMEIVPDIAHNGKEALVMVKEKEYHLILMDIRMPIMDGYTATKEIRALNAEKYKKIPIIAMTANAMKQDIDTALTTGMNDHLSKPVEPEIFYFLVQKWLTS